MLNRRLHLLSDCRVDLNGALTGTKLLVEFTLTAQSNNLLHDFNISKRQIAIHKLISFMKYEKNMSWRRISSWLNRSGIKTHTGKTWSKTGSSVHSVIKRMKQREHRFGHRKCFAFHFHDENQCLKLLLCLLRR